MAYSLNGTHCVRLYLFGYSLTVIAYNHKSIHNVAGNIVTKAKVHLRFVLCFNEDLLP